MREFAQNCDKTAKKKPRGKGFAKGDDPRRNKGGRPRIPDDAKVALARLWPFAVNTLERIITTGDDAAKLKAIQIVLDRSLGTTTTLGVLDQIQMATVETDEVVSILSEDPFMTRRKVPDDELQERARDAIREAMDEIEAQDAPGLGKGD